MPMFDVLQKDLSLNATTIRRTAVPSYQSTSFECVCHDLGLSSSPRPAKLGQSVPDFLRDAPSTVSCHVSFQCHSSCSSSGPSRSTFVWLDRQAKSMWEGGEWGTKRPSQPWILPHSNAASMSSWAFVRISSAACRVTCTQAAYCAYETKVECSPLDDDGRFDGCSSSLVSG
ncbi:hypothetical protein BBK36DRAFT_22266 [Trichoderma citrinoviride]|uniref:Uncharacterized protein n=1 Tax=Trichoderma citrinoviride TaxID=58853 RepID=A0A2T4B347_9HYPO|nr:hypothetical protein BBK36DRAFT_22266 [Trichoderma citrinoviride]PTB63763.1 hypothetical protein BBK36DRAFT_22266 [Trichoderma citrinoviride]